MGSDARKNIAAVRQLIWKAAQKKMSCPSNVDMGRELGISKDQVCHALAILNKWGEIEVEHQGNWKRRIKIGLECTSWTKNPGRPKAYKAARHAPSARKCLGPCGQEFVSRHPPSVERVCPSCKGSEVFGGMYGAAYE